MIQTLQIPSRENLGLVIVAPTPSSPTDWPSLAALQPHVHDVVIVLVNTKQPKELPETPHQVISVSPTTHGHLFLEDSPATYQEGPSLAGESYPGPFSNQLMIADWSTVRNLGLDACRTNWRLVLDAGDIVDHPEHLLLACHLLEQNQGDAGLLQLRPQQSYDARLSLGSTGQCFEGRAIPAIDHALKPVVLSDCLAITIPTPSQPSSTNVFKILYAGSRKRRWQVDPTDLLHLAHHAGPDLELMRPIFLAAHPREFPTPDHHSWFYVLQGELMEKRGQVTEACRSYELALEVCPGWKAALRLARARFTERRWHDVVEAHHRAMALRHHPHLLDDAPLDFDSSLVLVAASLHALGQEAPAQNAARHLRRHHPTSPAVTRLCEILKC